MEVTLSKPHCFSTVVNDEKRVVIDCKGELHNHTGWFPLLASDGENTECLHLVSDFRDDYFMSSNGETTPIHPQGIMLTGPALGRAKGEWYIRNGSEKSDLCAITPNGNWRITNCKDAPGEVRRVQWDMKQDEVAMICHSEDMLFITHLTNEHFETIYEFPNAVDAHLTSNKITTLSQNDDRWTLDVIDRHSGNTLVNEDLTAIINDVGDPDWWLPLSVSDETIAVGLGHTTWLMDVDGNTQTIDAIHFSFAERDPLKREVSNQNISHPKANTETGTIGIVLLCHPPYADRVEKAIASIDKAGTTSDKVLVCDGFTPSEYDINIPDSWMVKTGEWGSPNPGRNIGTKALDTDWVVFFDADNEMLPSYLDDVNQAIENAEHDVGILYPTIHFVDAETEQFFKMSEAPEWNRWDLAQRNFIDTSSAWRRVAVLGAGGWDEDTPSEDDYNLAERLVRQGWRGAPCKGVTHHEDHWEEPGRWQQAFDNGKETEALWRARSLSILSLLSGRKELFPEWSSWFFRNDFPPMSDLILVNNSPDEDFANILHDFTRNIIATKKFSSVKIVNRTMDTLSSEHLTHYFDKKKHQHVANMYSTMLSSIETTMTLTLEDDVFPPDGALWNLYERYTDSFCDGGHRLFAVAAAYGDPTNPTAIVTASDGNASWGEGAISWNDLKDNPLRFVNYVGGGCTLWGNWALQGNVPFGDVYVGDEIRGWDHQLCDRIRAQDGVILLDGNVKCDHKPRGYSD